MTVLQSCVLKKIVLGPQTKKELADANFVVSDGDLLDIIDLLKGQKWVVVVEGKYVVTDEGKKALVLAVLSREGQTVTELAGKTNLPFAVVINMLSRLRKEEKVEDGEPQKGLGGVKVCTYRLAAGG